MPANNELIVFQKPKQLYKDPTLNEREEPIDEWENVSFAHLPVELFIEVLMYLRPKKLIAIACCSKTLNELILASYSKPGQLVWKRLYLRAYPSDDSSARIPWVERYRQKTEQMMKKREECKSICVQNQKIWYAENICSSQFTFTQESITMDDDDRKYTKISNLLNIVTGSTCALIRGQPCVVARYWKLYKCYYIEGVNIFTLEDIDDEVNIRTIDYLFVEVLVKFKKYELVDIEDQFAVLMECDTTDHSNSSKQAPLMRSDLQIPNNHIGDEITVTFDNLKSGKLILIKVMSSLGVDVIVAYELVDEE